jgi:hypothetical protein
METSTSSEIPQVVETMDAIEGTLAMNGWKAVDEGLYASEPPRPDMVRLVLRVPKDNCQHTDKKEVRPNRFECDDCGSSWRFVRKSAIRRRMMLR